MGGGGVQTNGVLRLEGTILALNRAVIDPDLSGMVESTNRNLVIEELKG